LGREIDHRTVITAGLQEGQKIVASAQFLLDSEASLSGVFAPRLPATIAPTLDLHDAHEDTGVQP
jgi:membrane fusion protein, copper/silver efflux system